MLIQKRKCSLSLSLSLSLTHTRAHTHTHTHTQVKAILQICWAFFLLFSLSLLFSLTLPDHSIYHLLFPRECCHVASTVISPFLPPSLPPSLSLSLCNTKAQPWLRWLFLFLYIFDIISMIFLEAWARVCLLYLCFHKNGPFLKFSKFSQPWLVYMIHALTDRMAWRAVFFPVLTNF